MVKFMWHVKYFVEIWRKQRILFILLMMKLDGIV